MWVLINGKEFAADARGPKPDPAAKESALSVDLSGADLIPGQENKIEVIAWNAEGYLSSRGRVLMIRGPESKTVDAELYAIVAGVSQYANSSINLAFSGKDAADMAQALRVSAKRLFGTEKVHFILLTDYEGAEGAMAPSRENLEKAFIEARKSKPTDILVVYLAGHGVMMAGGDSDYHYLTKEANSTELDSDPAVRKKRSVSSLELTEWIKVIPALKQVMVLDTCAAGAAAVKLAEKRSLSSDQIRSLERLKDRTGFHVLMGAAADKVSLEASQYGQGLLTYSLLEAMKGAALREDQFVDVQKLFQHAADRVPELARSVGGMQRPIVASPRGVSFDIGQVTAEDKERIPLAMVKPMFLRTNFQGEDDLIDSLQLAKFVNIVLRDVSAVSRGGKLVFADGDELPGAYMLAGRYSVEGDNVMVKVNIYRDKKKQSQFTISGNRNDIRGLAQNIVMKATGELSK